MICTITNSNSKTKKFLSWFAAEVALEVDRYKAGARSTIEHCKFYCKTKLKEL